MFGPTSERLERAAAPHDLVLEPNSSRPPPALLMSRRRSLKGRPGGKCDLRHAGSHTGAKRGKPMPDSPLGTDGECTGQQCGGIADDDAALRLLGDARRCDGIAEFIASTCW